MRLHGLLASAAAPEFGPAADMDKLRRLLQSADIVKPEEIPSDVVTMNSQVQLRNDEAGIETTLSLVFPADARRPDVERPKLSVFTRTGASLLGRKVGDRVDRRLRILGLPYQPEAAGELYV
jgi:regulator of nucleoside diphosphate kinase